MNNAKIVDVYGAPLSGEITGLESPDNKLETVLNMPFGISNRHIHLTTEDYKILTGKEDMKSVKNIRQPGQYVTADKFFLANACGDILQGSRGNSYVGLIGPARGASQVELLQNDFEQLGMENPQTRMSGNLDNTHGISIVEANSGNEVKLNQGVIIAKSHGHFTPETADKYGIKNGSDIIVGLVGSCGGMALHYDVEAKVSKFFEDEIHIDQQLAPKGNFGNTLEATIFREVSNF